MIFFSFDFLIFLFFRLLFIIGYYFTQAMFNLVQSLRFLLFIKISRFLKGCCWCMVVRI